MQFRISPALWPVLSISAPFLLCYLAVKNKNFIKNRQKAQTQNQKLLQQAFALDLPELDFLEITVLVEHKTKNGFAHDPGVSYLIKTNFGSIIFDVGFGDTTKALSQNIQRLNPKISAIKALVISHLHMDHMGGAKAARKNTIFLPKGLEELISRPCYLPAQAYTPDFETHIVQTPQPLPIGLGSTGPLARSLFFLGLCEEQSLIAKIKNKGAVIITGCGHPKLSTIIKMTNTLIPGKIHAIAGGLHFPITASRLRKSGLELQQIFGTGKPPWQTITEKDLDQAVIAIKQAQVERLLLSAHDTCDQGLDMLAQKTKIPTEILKCGATYRF